MNLQKKLIQLSEYKCSFKYVDSYFLVSMTYPENWSIIPSEDRSIEVAEEGGTTFYAAPIETDIENAFCLIDDTIRYNLDVEKKMSLLKYNIGKLQELFAEKDLEELETIEFIFKLKKKETVKDTSLKKTAKKTTRKYNKRKNITVNEEKNVEETINEDYEPIVETLTSSRFNDEDPCKIDECQRSAIKENKYLEEIER